MEEGFGLGDEGSMVGRLQDRSEKPGRYPMRCCDGTHSLVLKEVRDNPFDNVEEKEFS